MEGVYCVKGKYCEYVCALVKEKGEVCNKTGGKDNYAHNHTQI